LNQQYIDLHVHSTASDGTYTPSELVKEGEQIGLYALALTDHDTIDGVEEAMEEALDKKIKIIPGIELSADFNYTELHILGLNLDYENKEFLKKIDICKEQRDRRNHILVEKMNKCGFNISMDLLYEKYSDSSITRAHFARYLIEEGIVEDKDEAFKKYLGYNCPCYVPKNKLSPIEAISIIKEANGFPVLAHPLLYGLNDERLKSTISYLKNNGLMGIEAIYSLNSTEDDLRLSKLAKNYNLFVTGGSDFHGSNKKDIFLGVGKGNLKIEKNLLDNIKK